MSFHGIFFLIKNRNFWNFSLRVYINISQIYLSFYITQTQHEPKKFVALLPLTAYLSSMLASLVLGLGSVSKRAGGKVNFCLKRFQKN